MSSQYMYGSLQEKQIRLLSVTEDESAPHGIVLDLSEVDLEDAKYTALSYTWGRPEPLDMDPAFDEDKIYQLRCGGGFLFVRQNLFDFLQQTRTLGHPVPLLWIDALCINQVDLDERSKQVLLMSKIYASAQHVWIWLGARDPSEGAHRILDEFIPAVLEHYKELLEEFQSNVLWSSQERLIEKAIGSDAWSIWASSWREYVNLVQRCWFSRGWTIQEVARPDLSAISVFAGTRKYPWSQIYWFLDLVMSSRWFSYIQDHTDSDSQHALLCATGRPLILERIRRTIGPFEGRTHEQQWYESLLDTMIVAGRHAMSDKRDVIYACLGMMLQIAPEGIESAIVPDYNLSIEETYTRFTGVLLQKMSQLQVLSLVKNQEERNYKNMPSWVPDYSNFLRGSGNPLARDTRRRRTDGASSVSAVPRVIGNRLYLHGACLTTVKEKIAGHEVTDFSNYILDMCRESRQYPELMQSMRETVWNTMVWRELPLGREDQEIIFQQWLLRRYETEVSTEHFETDKGAEIQKSLGAGLSPGVFSKDWILHVNESFSKYVQGHSRMMDRACMYIATNGRLAVGASWLEPGDEIWIFENGHLPFLLRPNADGETYRLIGETYMHGVMRGEAMTDDFISEFGPVVLI
ncbi:hypothetical protein PFICI_03119 [Pestalotiopsis fici W106-1]|uniref:Heterokaryon incompatibility domain-containing protein n=1 Tax=Pestalotiopsis fici (strain W106-1 / CGMCC3.15140) TaxID=1229662 RepID=W3XGF8_PESFW|nr:uncharacterized protein PFICI_03119 [Pestalotiopsis fici W106-1]ETS85094.1 hypothetical protein PFICI_03119 [Pestalotiopsis fici W106-1]